ncbi:phosphoenolpyruvate--protein phosphotransferase [Gallaecimonas kandeliae]|uniref:phosphoenolpyruvate--protein phosphotransferase n=1 Tax=Gallaecimonas kandeliae TaxID=3029055 RepID=UPI0026490B00|nr:phosphoenolpyruvate--protein phosphotransferase [Gallaecimonas kandeliae]WKE64978.1 phosphoenolpyruvate--protein phosphotransferase [Gallaecimonas kandeliae]
MLTRLQRIVQQVNSAASLDQAVSWLVGAICELMNTEVCSVYLADADQSLLQLVATQGLTLPPGTLCTLSYQEGLVGLVATKEEPINLAAAQDHPNFKLIEVLNEELFQSFLGVPIIYRRRVLGVLTIQQRDARIFDSEEEACLVTLANQLAPALANVEERTRLLRAQTGWKRSATGQAGAPGIALGACLVRIPSMTFEDLPEATGIEVAAELRRFDEAVSSTQESLRALARRFDLPAQTQTIFELYVQLLSPASLGDPVRSLIGTGLSAEWALKAVVEEAVDRFNAMEDSYLKERAADLKDVGLRLLQALGAAQMNKARPEGDIILVADEVTATMLAEVPREQLKGIVSRRGSGHSHAAILARALGIPAVLGVSALPLSALPGRRLVIDGYTGRCFIDPEPALEREYRRLVSEEAAISQDILASAQGPAVTLDGQRVRLYINAGLSADTDVAAGQGADGVGLYRTEVPFMLANRFPGEEEQFRLYGHVLSRYPNQPVTLRTLDVGGDKPLPYLPIAEDNPFLGWRGIRITLDQPDIFLIQLKAMLRAHQQHGNLQILLPMVSSVAEVDEALRLMRQAHHELCEVLGDFPLPKVGVMVEVPAALYLLPSLADRVQFVSVGSNDLTQYLLAVDRNNPRVADLFNSFHPAVVQALAQIQRDCAALGLPVSVCGELAGEVMGIALLLALGYRQLSMNASQVARAKHLLKKLSLKELSALKDGLLACQDADQLCWQLHEPLSQAGFGHWLRAGR